MGAAAREGRGGGGTVQRGLADVNGARLYYELAGEGRPFVMLHAGIADRRQWDNEFAGFSQSHRVLRYDRRGFGESEPVEGEYSHMADLLALLDQLGLTEPAIVMGSSMGGGLALDLALTHPSRVHAVIMVGAGPSGLVLDLPEDPKAAEAEEAFDAGDLDRVAELETQMWFDGSGRTSEQVDPVARSLVREMDRRDLENEAKGLGKQMPNADRPAFDRLADVRQPVLLVAGAHDTPYILAAVEYMAQRLPDVATVTFADAAHMVNMEQPVEFHRAVARFLDGLSHAGGPVSSGS